ncbi:MULTISPECIES: tyrosine-protein phosphatase [unclassified Sphingomonas]|uniref:tyrosine-protein phosphatase n=1 Tax=unclassified Sphingomonas TaxID=196159 RepID=UPI000929F565|nr:MULTISPECIES: tyrosine-protein phosphatase [unclassified Sphingomonas]OJU17580.1 MAG: protein tyrosine phosphatase [Sphingomonas sp. 66-10]
MNISRKLIGATALALAVSAPAPLIARGKAQVARPAAARVAAIPFTAASVTRAGGGYRIEWTGQNAGTVRVFASERPDPVSTGKPVAEGLGTAAVTVDGLAPDHRWFFTLVPAEGEPLVVADRGLHLATVPNLRDIGGYRTSDGRWVKMGLIYRSDQLNRLSDADLAAMGRLGLTTIADLRTVAERTREPDRVAAGAEPLVLDIAKDSQGSLGGDMRGAMAAIASGHAAEMLVDANREFVSLPSARAGYRDLLQKLEAPGTNALLYHCTAGKDRTGWASAVILTLLGVPRETVLHDYMLSNTYLRAKNDAALAALAKSGSPMKPAYLEAAMTVRPDYIQAAFDEVEHRYGSFDNYIRHGLGLTEADIKALRARYLTK